MTGMRSSALCLATLLAGLATNAAAETRTVRGDSLMLTTNASVTIDTDEAAAGTVRLSADGSLSCLSIAGEKIVSVSTTGCSDDLETLRVTVSPDMPVTLSAKGDGTVHIGNLRSALNATLVGSADLIAGNVAKLTLSLNGGGDAVVGRVGGPATLHFAGGGDVHLAGVKGPLAVAHSGSGDLDIDTIDAPTMDLQHNGSGDTRIGSGTIGALNVRLSGSGDLTVAATVGKGVVSASGGSDAKFDKVTGSLVRFASGGSDITVAGEKTGGSDADDAAPVSHRSSTSHHSSSAHAQNVAGHVLATVFVFAVIFLVWRIVRRARSGSVGRRGEQNLPLHPGVVAVSDAMTRLEQRLGRMEGYVTTREFDLNRKFRDLK